MPIAAVEQVPGLHQGLGHEVAKAARTIAPGRGRQRLFDQRVRLAVLCELEVRIHREIGGMIVVGLDFERGCIRRDRLLPHPHHRIDVRRHVARVRDRRRDAGIALGRRDPTVRERREVVGVNDEVRHARMLRILLEQLLQDGHRLELI